MILCIWHRAAMFNSTKGSTLIWLKACHIHTRAVFKYALLMSFGFSLCFRAFTKSLSYTRHNFSFSGTHTEIPVTHMYSKTHTQALFKFYQTFLVKTSLWDWINSQGTLDLTLYQRQLCTSVVLEATPHLPPLRAHRGRFALNSAFKDWWSIEKEQWDKACPCLRELPRDHFYPQNVPRYSIISDGFAFELGFSEWVYLIPPSQQHFLWTGASVRLDHTQHTLKSPRGLLDYYFQTCRYCHWWGVSSYFRSSVSILRSSTNWSVYFLVRRLGLCLHLWSSLLSQVHCCVV